MTQEPEASEAALAPELLTGVGETGLERRRPLALGEMSRFLPAAVLAAEDHRFFDHPGLDVVAVGRALVANTARGEIMQGASTLTQQLVKNLALGPGADMAPQGPGRRAGPGDRAPVREGEDPRGLSQYRLPGPARPRGHSGRRGGGSELLGQGCAPARAGGERPPGGHHSRAESLLAGPASGARPAAPRCSAAPHARARDDRRPGARDGAGPAHRGARGHDSSVASPLLPRLRARDDRRGDDSGKPADLHDPRSEPTARRRGRGCPRAGPSGERQPTAPSLGIGGSASGRPRGAGSRDGRGPSPGRWPRLRDVRLQPGDARSPPARIRVQALRLPRGPTPRRRRSAAGGDAGLCRRGPAHRGADGAGGVGAPQFRGSVRRADHRAAGPRALFQRRRRAPRPGGRPRGRHPDGARRRIHEPDDPRARPRAGKLRGDAARARVGVRDAREWRHAGGGARRAHGRGPRGDTDGRGAGGAGRRVDPVSPTRRISSPTCFAE